MPVIGHHAISVYRERHSRMSQFQHPIKSLIIFLFLKECQSGNRAIDHMEASSSRAESWASRHSKKVQNEYSHVNIELRPFFSAQCLMAPGPFGSELLI